MALVEKLERRWSCTILDKRGDKTGTGTEELFSVNSIDGDLKSVKIRLGREERIVSVSDMVALLKRVASNTTGISVDLGE
jgi:hypothetical protein